MGIVGRRDSGEGRGNQRHPSSLRSILEVEVPVSPMTGACFLAGCGGVFSECPGSIGILRGSQRAWRSNTCIGVLCNAPSPQAGLVSFSVVRRTMGRKFPSSSLGLPKKASGRKEEENECGW